jgi:hypothetical protein
VSTLIVTGCAECESGMGAPLMEAHTFTDDDAARAWVAEQKWMAGGEWTDHPQGGTYTQSGQGEAWLLPEEIL